MPKSKRKIISFNSKENNLLFQHRGEGLENIRAEEYRDFNDEVRDEKSFKSYIKKLFLTLLVVLVYFGSNKVESKTDWYSQNICPQKKLKSVKM